MILNCPLPTRCLPQGSCTLLCHQEVPSATRVIDIPVHHFQLSFHPTLLAACVHEHRIRVQGRGLCRCRCVPAFWQGMANEANSFLWALIDHNPRMLSALTACNVEAPSAAQPPSEDHHRDWPAILVFPAFTKNSSQEFLCQLLCGPHSVWPTLAVSKSGIANKMPQMKWSLGRLCKAAAPSRAHFVFIPACL